jgi:hypothetical protein
MHTNMNFLITLDLDSDTAPDFSNEFKEFVKKFNLEVTETLLDNSHTAMFTKQLAKVEESEELSPEEAEKTPALNEDDLCPTCGEAECNCPEPEHKCEMCDDDHKCDECSSDKEDVKEELKMFDFDPCRVLTLSTLVDIPVKVNLQEKNTKLFVSSVLSENQVVRFHYNSHYHALPSYTDNRVHIVNEGHDVGSATVRLVLDFAGKTFPSLVDITEGQEDVLIIGSDLFEIIQKDKGTSDVVSTK